MINIYGKGGHARMINATLKNDPKKHWVIGGLYNDDDYKSADSSLFWIIGVGNNEHRKSIVNRNSFRYNSFVFSSYENAKSIGDGCFLAPGSVVQNDVFIGNHVIINTSASVDHDCKIEDFVHIAPNVTLCGAVEVGEGSFIGAGSVVIPGVKIGKNCIIGAGSVVIRDIPDNSKAYGNPAKIK